MLSSHLRDGKSAVWKKARPTGFTVAASPADESELVCWVNELRADGVPVSADSGAEVFQASWWWQRRFLEQRRLALQARTRQVQVSPSDLEATTADFAAVAQAAKAQFGVDRVWNADQTGIICYAP